MEIIQGIAMLLAGLGLDLDEMVFPLLYFFNFFPLLFLHRICFQSKRMVHLVLDSASRHIGFRRCVFCLLHFSHDNLS